MSTTDASQWDKRGIIRDALSLEGLSESECRSIFFDWAFGLEKPEMAAQAARELLQVHSQTEHTDHPILGLLANAAQGGQLAVQGRRGGRSGRRKTE